MPGIQIVRVEGALPAGIADLARTASAEGVRHVDRLMADWESGAQRFDADGAALFAAFDAGRLAGIGGVKRETAEGESAMRMHRFYVHPVYRRLGIGKRIARAVMSHALEHASILTCNARASAAAPLFWEALGFEKAEAESNTHIFRTGIMSDA